MSELGSGVLLKLLEDINVEDDNDDDLQDNVIRKPVLLQIRSIIPVLEEGDLWPNQGFYLKVSDSTHALFVSLPQREHEMIMCNKLRLGQYIYVDRLKTASPVPMLKGVRPVVGRHPCFGNPKELNSLKNPRRCLDASDVEDNINVKKRSPRERHWRDRTNDHQHAGRKSSDNMSSKGDGEKEISDALKGLRKIYSCFVDQNNQKGSDSDSSTISSSPTMQTPKRRSWDAREATRPLVGEIFDTRADKHDLKPFSREHRRRSSTSSETMQLSSQNNPRYDSSDDNSSTGSRRRSNKAKCTKSSNSFNRSMSCISVKPPENESLNSSVLLSSVNEENWIETEISWAALPPNLAKLGKEVLSQRNMALQVAVEALQEASAAQGVLKCLSTYSELQSAKGGDQQPTVDVFLDLQDDLARTTLIVGPLTNVSPQRTSCPDGESEKLALDRKKNATSWAKAALESDLSPCSATKRLKTPSAESITTPKRSRTSRGSKPKSPFGIKKHRKNDENHIGLAGNNENQQGCTRSDLSSAADLAKSLQTESRRQFLVYLEKYLDGVSKTISFRSDSQVAEMMSQVKRVNDWLDMLVSENGNSSKTGVALDSFESEAYRRVRDKMYDVLLKHVERTTMALGGTSRVAED